MAHRFINLQNELGKPVIAAGTKNSTGGKDFIDISWLKTTDEKGEKVVVDTTLEEVRRGLDQTITDTTLNVLTEMDSRVKEVASTIDTKIDAAKTELSTDINQTAALVLNTLEPQIDSVKEEVDSAKVDITSLTTTLKDTREALKSAVVFEEKVINTTNGAYVLADGEKFISAVYANEGFIPTVNVSDGVTTLQFFTDGEKDGENIEITIAKKVDLYNASFVPPVQGEVTLGDGNPTIPEFPMTPIPVTPEEPSEEEEEDGTDGEGEE